MVSKITLLEPHFDGAQFGPASMENNPFETAPQSGEDPPEEAEGKSRLRILVQGTIGFILVFVVMYGLLRGLSDDE